MKVVSDKLCYMADGQDQWLMVRTNKAQRICDEVKAGKTYDIEIKEHRERRSLDANAYFHVLVGKIAEALGADFEETKTNLVVAYGTEMRDTNGEVMGVMVKATSDVNQMYRYVRWFDRRTVEGVEFDCYIVLKNTHLLDTKEMHRLIDGTISEAKGMDIEVLTPDELARLEGY